MLTTLTVTLVIAALSERLSFTLRELTRTRAEVHSHIALAALDHLQGHIVRVVLHYKMLAGVDLSSVHRGERSATRATVEDHKRIAHGGHEAVDEDVQRSIQAGRTADAELVELSARSSSCDINVEDARGILRVLARDRQDRRLGGAIGGLFGLLSGR